MHQALCRVCALKRYPPLARSQDPNASRGFAVTALDSEYTAPARPVQPQQRVSL